MKNHILTESKIGEAKVVVDILPFNKVIVNRKLKGIKYITIHETDNTAPAKNQHSCMNNWNNNLERNASWHISCDWDSIYQGVRFDIRCKHAGSTKGNDYALAIEISQNDDAAKQKQAYLNAIALCKILMKEYNIPLDNVVQHNYWSGKNCPRFLRLGKYGLNWTWFKNSLKSTQNIETPPTINKKEGWVLRLQKELNIQGFRDKNGKKLIEDGIQGPLTLSACPTVRQNARGNITRLIQEKVGSPIDGIYGKNTKAKVISYQKSKGISADGIVGRNTWTKMLNM